MLAKLNLSDIKIAVVQAKKLLLPLGLLVLAASKADAVIQKNVLGIGVKSGA